MTNHDYAVHRIKDDVWLHNDPTESEASWERYPEDASVYATRDEALYSAAACGLVLDDPDRGVFTPVDGIEIVAIAWETDEDAIPDDIDRELDAEEGTRGA
ncbi:hypothetical protein [Bifidobacterium castoris]|uniref:Uncharacterized protein n=1 Tax=Bifidobacterium castoris TaxID=2306972 RepID=A0A430FAG7_9BIFI|nr:hypothetical protein [Bifidobacterium castoris]RSX49840.1 hypothetical protein D2E22_0301 [Bifidobacterium castoris]